MDSGLIKIMLFGRHNFYVFPRQELSGLGPRNEFLCQTTSIDFLAKYQFDFNACIHEGCLLFLSFLVVTFGVKLIIVLVCVLHL